MIAGHQMFIMGRAAQFVKKKKKKMNDDFDRFSILIQFTLLQKTTKNLQVLQFEYCAWPYYS